MKITESLAYVPYKTYPMLHEDSRVKKKTKKVGFPSGESNPGRRGESAKS